jgi:chloride channel 3/4/5
MNCSPRVILVEERGTLVGLVTVKDVLRFIATEKPGEHGPSWDERGGLDGLLEEVGRYLSGIGDSVMRVLRRFGLRR